MMTSLGSIKRLVFVMEPPLLFCVAGASFYTYYFTNVRGLRGEVLRRLSSCSLLLLCLSTNSCPIQQYDSTTTNISNYLY
jgi:hypothetical protein